MKLVTQPKQSGICGQCCVAMITGEKIDKVLDIFGHSRKSGTRTKELVRALQLLGFKCDQKLTRFTNFSGLPDLGIVKITYDWRKNNGHWAVIKVRHIAGSDFLIYCPGGEISSWLTYGTNKGRITSFLKVTK